MLVPWVIDFFFFFDLKVPDFTSITVKFLLVDFGPAFCLGRELWIINQLYQNNLCFPGLDKHTFCVFIQVSGKIIGQVGARALFALQVPSPGSFPSTEAPRVGAVQTTMNQPCILQSADPVTPGKRGSCFMGKI